MTDAALGSVALLAICIGAAVSQQPTPTALRQQIDTQGPRAVVTQLWSDPRQYEAVLEAIESGAPDWLDIAERLRPGTDAGLSLMLDWAVAVALPRAPERILGLLGNAFTVEDVCTIPYDEDEREAAERYKEDLEAALAGVERQDLLGLRDRCLAQFRSLLPNER